MKVALWGTRGSVAAPGAETARYGGNTSCVEVKGSDGTIIILDAGTGIRRLGMSLPPDLASVHLLLTHLHMDHIQGLGFFSPLRNPEAEVHIWGTASTTLSLRQRLMRYLSPPLFPVRLRELPCKLTLHEVPRRDFEIGEFRVSSALVCHPDSTVGYRITNSQAAIAYLPDHEPALGIKKFPLTQEWTSGYDIASGVDFLIHDAQYTNEEYSDRVGWGHSSMQHAIEFGKVAEVKHLLLFHHDPTHDDKSIDLLTREAIDSTSPPFKVTAAAEGSSFKLKGL